MLPGLDHNSNLGIRMAQAVPGKSLSYRQQNELYRGKYKEMCELGGVPFLLVRRVIGEFIGAPSELKPGVIYKVLSIRPHFSGINLYELEAYRYINDRNKNRNLWVFPREVDLLTSEESYKEYIMQESRVGYEAFLHSYKYDYHRKIMLED